MTRANATSPLNADADLDHASLCALLDALLLPAALVDHSTDQVKHANDAMTRLVGLNALHRGSRELFPPDSSSWSRRPLSPSLSLVQPAEAPSVPQAAFVAMLGHELRNPLAPIRHAAEMLGGDPEANERARAIIERQVSHMTRLVNDLLDAGRATTGRLRIAREQMWLADAIEAGHESCERLLARRGHHVRLDLSAIDGVEVRGDLVRLTQVVSNLVSNAAKFTPRGGQITVTARLEGTEAVIEVRDNGRGFTEESAARFFDPFVQAVQPLDRTTGGLGLGLPLVRYVVEEHGGTVTSSSDGPGTGATFTVRLPSATRGTTPPAPASDDPPRTGGEIDRVLVVDDNEDAAQMMSLILNSRGVECVVAYDGESALDEMKATQFPLALVDIGLPGLDGYGVASQASALPTRPTKLVALSGYGQSSDIDRALAAGFDAYHVKPISIEELDALLSPKA